jgi:monofunctional biosynthetic peptidoglycan transglycosylase
MLSRKVEAMIDGKPSAIKYTWKSLDELSSNIPKAVLYSEDQKFYDHYGFDLKGMQKAFERNKKSQVIRGGSTISQQVAKNVFLWQHKSYFRKALEAYFTVLIEIFWSKERILEVYLNVAETGINTFGMEEGCKRYFGHSASKTSKREAAALAAVLPSPKRYAVKNPGPYMNRRINRISNGI